MTKCAVLFFKNFLKNPVIEQTRIEYHLLDFQGIHHDRHRLVNLYSRRTVVAGL